ncbi:MAG: Histone acetyltransferase kat6b [Marteilia pararefringens]
MESGTIQGPEGPFSDLGRCSYLSFWRFKILTHLASLDKVPDIATLAIQTGFKPSDIIFTLDTMNALQKISPNVSTSSNYQLNQSYLQVQSANDQELIIDKSQKNHYMRKENYKNIGSKINLSNYPETGEFNSQSSVYYQHGNNNYSDSNYRKKSSSRKHANNTQALSILSKNRAQEMFLATEYRICVSITSIKDLVASDKFKKPLLIFDKRHICT